MEAGKKILRNSLTLLPVCLAATVPVAAGKENPRPNIIYIMSDDHAWQAVSAYGGPLAGIAPTPNIDRIAQSGMRFDRCLVTNSISGPCRAVVLTGKYSHINGFLSNDNPNFNGAQQTFPKLLQKAGYSTAMIGKWHLGTDPTGFDHWDILPGQGNYYNPDFITSSGRKTEKGYVTEIITSKSIEWIKKATEGGKPFMLMMHHKAPHREWQPGPNELTLYKNTDIPEPKSLFDDYSGRGRAAKEQDMTISETMRIEEDLKMYKDPAKKNVGLNRMTSRQNLAWDSVYNPIIRGFYATNPQGRELISFKYKRYMEDYLACIAAVDKSVGAVLDYLKATGLDRNTVVIYCSDQGFYLGEHGWFDKRFMYEESYRTPLLVSWPGVTQPNSVNKDMVSNLDFAETILEMAGVKIPADMQGVSLMPLLNGKTPLNWRKEHYYHYYEYPAVHSVKRHYGISTDRYKLIHFYHDIDEWELYDLQSDPNEMKNVYSDPAYKKTKEYLHKRLRILMKEYADSEELARSFIKN
jgi:arylsulfatase A-like enzyme